MLPHRKHRFKAIRSEIVAGVECRLDRTQVRLSPWGARNLIGHPLALHRSRRQELLQTGLQYRPFIEGRAGFGTLRIQCGDQLRVATRRVDGWARPGLADANPAPAASDNATPPTPTANLVKDILVIVESLPENGLSDSNRRTEFDRYSLEVPNLDPA